jgi:hypothetical protein
MRERQGCKVFRASAVHVNFLHRDSLLRMYTASLARFVVSFEGLNIEGRRICAPCCFWMTKMRPLSLQKPPKQWSFRQRLCSALQKNVRVRELMPECPSLEVTAWLKWRFLRLGPRGSTGGRPAQKHMPPRRRRTKPRHRIPKHSQGPLPPTFTRHLRENTMMMAFQENAELPPTALALP